MPASESAAANFNGQAVRELRVTTLVDGAPTTVIMPVLALADANGDLISNVSLERLLKAQLEELQAIRELLGQQLGGFVLPRSQ